MIEKPAAASSWDDGRSVGAASAMIGSGTALGGFLADKPERPRSTRGTPVRSSGLSSGSYSPQFYDEVEEQEALDVLRSKSPFRRPARWPCSEQGARRPYRRENMPLGSPPEPPPCMRRWPRLESGPATK